MEVGAVKQAFNNELILLKKKLNQAKINTIHKLTRKAKTFMEKKAPEPIKEKLKRKAESAVQEVLIIKKVKVKDIGKFMITHKGKLQDHLNKPQVDHDKACARLCLHKVLQDKYKSIRSGFSDIPIEDLFMSRIERRKIKKEAKEKQKEKRDKKNKKKAAKADGDWSVEDVEMVVVKNSDEKVDENGDDAENGSIGDDGEGCNVEEETALAIQDSSEEEKLNETNDSDSDNEDVENTDEEESPEVKTTEENNNQPERDGSDDEETADVGKFVKLSPAKKENKLPVKLNELLPVTSLEMKVKTEVDKIVERNAAKKPKSVNKNKNINEKIAHRKFKRDLDVMPIPEAKVVDPFFITSTGDKYLSVAEPRQPDEVKDEHREGNRKLRRAVMFGHVPRPKPRQDNFRQDNNQDSRSNRQDARSNRQDTKPNRQNGFDDKSNDRFDRQNGFQKNIKFNSQDGNRKGNFNDKFSASKNNVEESKPEKLHPSWEAKKKQSGILPFQGKKIVFD